MISSDFTQRRVEAAIFRATRVETYNRAAQLLEDGMGPVPDRADAQVSAAWVWSMIAKLRSTDVDPEQGGQHLIHDDSIWPRAKARVEKDLR